jgi:hypothetical protein
MGEQLQLFQPVKPSNGLLSEVEALNEKVNDLWNKAIDEREDAPAGQKGELRKLTIHLEAMLVSLERIFELNNLGKGG